MQIDTGIIIAVIGSIGGIIMAIAQFVTSRSQSKVNSEKVISELIEKALGINKQELLITRELNKELGETVESLKKEIEDLRKDKTSYITELGKKDAELSHMRILLEECITKCKLHEQEEKKDNDTGN